MAKLGGWSSPDAPCRIAPGPKTKQCDECGDPAIFGEGVVRGEQGNWYCSSCCPDHVKNPEKYMREHDAQD